MQMKRFPIQVTDGALLREYEPKLKFINGFSKEPSNRSTYIDYSHAENHIVPVLKYHIFDGYEGLVHGCSTRQGGVSSGHLASMNLSSSRGDAVENVLENYRRFGLAASFEPSRLVCSDQVHKTVVYAATEVDAGRGTTDKEKLSEVDALVTNVPNLPLMTFYADCVPIYFYDPVKQAVGMAHSGWRGTVNDIAGKTVAVLREKYGTNPADLVCAIGPSICQSCYEVGKDVYDVVSATYNEEQANALLSEKENGKYLLDLHKACMFNLINAGVAREHIALPDLCTCCNPNVFFSHRASKGMRGNLGAVIMLRN